MSATSSRYRLIAFDVDGTLIGARQKNSVIWNLLNERFDRDDGGARYRAYMAGELSYERWVELDIGGWVEVGATREQIAEVIVAELFVVCGAEALLARLRDEGYFLAVISGTLDITLEVLLADQSFDAIHTNRIRFDDAGRISGWQATPFDMSGKAEALGKLAEQLEIPLSRTVFVGDNINDIDVLRAAGLAVAFEPKHRSVSEVADHVIEGDLRRLLGLLGH